MAICEIEQTFLSNLTAKLDLVDKFKTHKIGNCKFNIILNSTCSSLFDGLSGESSDHDDEGKAILTSPSDLTPGVYEGGFKVWECSRDMIEFIENDLKLTGPLNCLDLGCGSGIVGIFLLKLVGCNVDFQDFNHNVLKYYTLSNILINLKEKGESLKEVWNNLHKRINLISGDWSDFPKTRKYDLILSCETIYNMDNYSKLVDILVNCLSSNGIAYFAAKSYYFGVGGGNQEFQDFINDLPSRPLICEQVKTIEDCVERNILKITLTT